MNGIYYIRINSLNFYDNRGRVCSGFIGNAAKRKFFSLLKQGRLPRISLASEIKVTIQ